MSWSRQKADSFFGLAREKLEKERLAEAKAVSQLLTTVDAYDNKRNVGAGSLVDPNRI